MLYLYKFSMDPKWHPPIWILWELDLCKDLRGEVLDLNGLLLAEVIFLSDF